MGYGCPLFHKIGIARSVENLQIRDARCVSVYVESPLRQDNIGKKCRVPFIYILAPPELIASIQNVKAIGV